MYTLQTIADKLQILRSAIRSTERIEHFLTDSRSLSHPESSLFFAIRTVTGDGHLYIDQLYQHGVRNFIIKDDFDKYAKQYPEASFLEVRDVVRSLQKVASEWRQEFQIPVIGITGSNGKTIVKEFLYQLLADSYQVVRSPRSYNSQLGVPLSVLKMTSEDQLAIFEAGISQLGEMSRIEEVIKPTIGVITNIGSAHQENFSSIAQKVDEKLKLFEGCEHIVYNLDEPEIVAGLKRMDLLSRASGWSRKDPNAMLFIHDIDTQRDSTLLEFTTQGRAYSLEIPFTDQASIEDVLTSILTLVLINPALLDRADLFAKLEPVEMRLELIEGYRDNLIINDVYNNDINSLKIALDYQQQRAKDADLAPVLILTEIQQSALNQRPLYNRVGELISKYKIHKFYGIGRDLFAYREFFPTEIDEKNFFPSVEDFLDSDIPLQLSHSCILIKGARSFHCERISDRLSRKIHETTLEVDLDAIAHNLQYYRSKLPQDVRCIAMVKAQGYGVGAYEVAKKLDQMHIGALAVAVADEGRELRSQGILTPILVMNPEPAAFDTLLEWHLEPVIFSWNLLRAFTNKVNKQGFDNVSVHLEIDTGMHRLGFRPEEIEEIARFFATNHWVRARSIFTHLAAADLPEEDAFTLNQLNTFRSVADRFSEIAGYKPLYHALNTAGIERFPEYAFDRVRLGIGLYGISPTMDTHLLPAVRLRTTLLQKSYVTPNESIGYGRRGHLSKGGEIGIIPIGYADGYDRRMSCGRGWVVVRGKRCPIVGNVCMDTCMIDLSACPESQEGDEVILFGAPEARIEDLAKAIDTIPYELIADLAPRVRRVYYQNS